MEMKKNAKGWIGVLLVAGLLAGSIYAGTAEQKRQKYSVQENTEGIVLDYYIWVDEETYVRKVVEAWNALQGREAVRLHVLENEAHEEWLEAYEKDRGADILALRGNADVLKMQQRGQLLGLRDYLTKSELDVTAYGNLFHEITIENEYYALPTRSTCWALFYNKTLFDRAGLPYPEQMTWEEYEALAMKMSRQNGEERIYGGIIPPWIYHFSSIQQGYYLLDDNTAPLFESLAFLNRIYSSGSHVPFAAIKDRGDDCRYEFEKGNIAMMLNGEWMVNMFLEDEAAGLTVPEWGIAPAPVPEGVEEGTTVGMYQYVGITASCPAPEEAFAFLEFSCGELGAQIYAQDAIIPAYSNDTIKEIYREASGTETANVFFEAKRVQEQPMWEGYHILLNQFKECAERYLDGELSLAKAQSQFEARRKAARK